MDIYKINTPEDLMKGNSYVGRGIIIGKTKNSEKAAVAYFIMGRSANSRNRIFTKKSGEIFTEPYDATKVQDPSLIIYSALKTYENNLIVTNGDQTDTIFDGLKNGLTFAKSLESREFEPDSPNYTPRISGMLTFEKGDFTYQMSILKSIDPEGSDCVRETFSYPSKAGLGHFIHTYICDGNPIPTFAGEPERIEIDDDIDAFSDRIWNCLDEDNRISLYTRMINLENGTFEDRIINKNK